MSNNNTQPIETEIETAPAPAAGAETTAPVAPAAPLEVSETGVRVLALVPIGKDQHVHRYITGVTDDGRVQASDNAEAAKPMQTAAARALVKHEAVKKAFKGAAIQIIEAE